ncbi:MAG: COX15/CtaA family protein [Rhodocyclaceae bacterium]|nr:COX15/CtaA family protein [Rhodocyclaceae bacterium]
MGAAIQLRRVRGLALLLTALSLGVVGVSAFLRLQGAGLGCVDWPACYGQLLTATTHSPPPLGRLIHRIVATSALLLTVYLAWQGWRSRPWQPWARQVLILLGLMLFLSVVGIWSADPRRIPVNFVNLLGGLGLVVMSWRIVMASKEAKTQGRMSLNPALAAGMALLTATVILGALIGASYTALDESVGGIALHWLHRACAVIASLLLGQAALKRPDSPASRVLLGLLGLEILLGAITVMGDFPLWAAVGHNVAAAALLACAAQLRRT